jgi:predicted dehydrogenase
LGSLPLWVSATSHNILQDSYEDVGFITLGYPNSVVGHIHVSWADPYKVRDIVLVGSEQRVYLNDMNPQEPIRIFEKGLQISDSDDFENRFTIGDGDIISPRIQLSEPLTDQCKHFIQCITDGTRPLTDGKSGLDVVKVLVSIDKSLKLNGERIYLETEGEKIV